MIDGALPASEFPVLKNFNINVDSAFEIKSLLCDIKSLLHDILKLENAVKDDLLSFDACNEQMAHLVSVPSSRNGVRFRKNVATGGTSWVFQ